MTQAPSLNLVDSILTLYRSNRGKHRPGADALKLGSLMVRSIDGYGAAHKVAKALGVTHGVVTHYVSLLSLSPRQQAALRADALTFKAARGLAQLKSHARQDEIAALLPRVPRAACERVTAIAYQYPEKHGQEILDMYNGVEPVREQANAALGNGGDPTRCDHCGGLIVDARPLISHDYETICINCGRPPGFVPVAPESVPRDGWHQASASTIEGAV